MLKNKWTKTFIFTLLGVVILIGGVFGARFLLVGEKKPFKICVQDMNTANLESFLREKYPELKYEIMKVPKYDMYMENKLTEEEISALPRLRTEIMSGNGPDLYILPSENTQLLKDVYLAADAGVFADITAKAAQSENFAQCNKEVMKAGQYNGKQFLVPLSFNLLTILSDAENAKALQSYKNPAEMVRFAQTKKDGTLQRHPLFADIYCTNANSLFDYAKRTARADNQFKDLILLHKDFTKLMRSEQGEKEELAYTLGAFELNAEYDPAILMEKSDEELVLTPVPNTEGGITATVENYAAISAGSKYKNEASAIIFELLLSKEIQGIDESLKRVQPYIFRGLPVREDCIDGLQRTYHMEVKPTQKLKDSTRAQIQKVYSGVNRAYIWNYELELVSRNAGEFLYDLCDIEQAQEKILTELQKVMAD